MGSQRFLARQLITNLPPGTILHRPRLAAGPEPHHITPHYRESIAVSPRAQELQHLIIVHWFSEVTIKPSLLGLATILFLSPSSQGDYRNVLAPGLFAYVPADIVTVELRQANVQQNDVGPALFN